ncbi:unnamed protein product [Cuscuta europaea]|uniref:Uncharacterized protein n=1 Tax=Cuscuta europaea TaxID=41803 RepID=A0A9P0YPA5_CUSEU|nr:unnamed protein product [Cuscuta europaea]
MSKNEEVMYDFDVDEGLDDLGQRSKRRQKTKKKMLLKKSADDKMVVKVNRFGVHAGKEWIELADYIAVVVRDHVSIVHDEWRHVAVKLKDEMWNHLKELFVLSENSKTHVLATMSVAFRNFKSELRTDFIYQHEHELQKLALPPVEYKHISKKEWKLFVKKTFSEEFVEKSNKAKERRKKHKLNHRLGSTGYGGLLLKKQEELGVNLEDIDRCDTWLLGRKRKDGTYDDDVKEVANEIEDLKCKVQEGCLCLMGMLMFFPLLFRKNPMAVEFKGWDTS